MRFFTFHFRLDIVDSVMTVDVLFTRTSPDLLEEYELSVYLSILNRAKKKKEKN